MHYWFLGILFLFSTWPAQADIADPNDHCYTEQCTLENNEQEGTTCDVCNAGPGRSPTGEEWDSGLDPTHCDNKFQGTNYEKVCQTRGESYWTEVWCDGPPAENYDEPDPNCGTDENEATNDDQEGTTESNAFGCASIDSVTSGTFFFLLGGILYARRRRSRTTSK